MQFIVENIDLPNKIVTIRTSSKYSISARSSVHCFLFCKHQIVVEKVGEPGPVWTRYKVRFDKLSLELNWPQLYPRWSGKRFAIPIWSLIATPGKKFNKPIKISVSKRAVPAGNLFRAIPHEQLRIFDDGMFCLLGGYQKRTFTIHGLPVSVHFENAKDGKYLTDLVRKTLSAHYRYFNEWLIKRLNLVIEEQSPRLKKQKGGLFINNSYGFGRYTVRYVRPTSRFEECSLIDLLEHELLHYYIETTAPAGSWFVEGLTTYLSRKLLVETEVFTSKDWLAIVRATYKDYLKNPLGPKTSVNSATKRIWEPRYGNLLYNKGFLITYLLDIELEGRLLEIGQDLYRKKIRRGKPFSEAYFMSILPASVAKKLTRLLDAKDIKRRFQAIPELKNLPVK